MPDMHVFIAKLINVIGRTCPKVKILTRIVVFYGDATTAYKKKNSHCGCIRKFLINIDLKHVVVDKLRIMFRISDILVQT